MSVRGDNEGDARGDSRWITCAELAEARGIKEPAAVRLVQRRRWERHPGNDGAMRIAVPLPELRPSRPVTPHVAPDITLVAPDGRDVETLARERLRADQAEAREAELRVELGRQGRELTATLMQAAVAETQVQALREALEEARRPAWRRWLGL